MSDVDNISPVESHKEQRMKNLRNASRRVGEFNKKMNGQHNVDSHSIMEHLSDAQKFLSVNARLLAMFLAAFIVASAYFLYKLQPKCVVRVDQNTQQIKIDKIKLLKISAISGSILLVVFVVLAVKMPQLRGRVFDCGDLCHD